VWLRTGYERSFDSAAGKNRVELAVGVTAAFYAVIWRVEDLLARAGKTVVGEARYLACLPKICCWCCACTCQASLTRLIWLSDIAETLRFLLWNQTIDYPLALSPGALLGIVAFIGVSSGWWKRTSAEIPKSRRKSLRLISGAPPSEAEFAERSPSRCDYDFDPRNTSP